jgi:hypothetical protein
MKSIINIVIGIVIGIIITIFLIYYIINYAQSVPAIPTCGDGYTLKDNVCKSTNTVPFTCPEIVDIPYKTFIGGKCIKLCNSENRPDLYKKEDDIKCIEADSYVGGKCPEGYTLEKDINKCIENKFQKLNYSCPDETHILYKDSCFRIE